MNTSRPEEPNLIPLCVPKDSVETARDAGASWRWRSRRQREAFAALNGVGPAKTRDWAETFLAIVNEEDGEGEVFYDGADADDYDDVDEGG